MYCININTIIVMAMYVCHYIFETINTNVILEFRTGKTQLSHTLCGNYSSIRKIALFTPIM